MQYSHRVWATHENIRIIRICLNEMYCNAHILKHLSYNFPNKKDLKQGMTYYHCFSDFLWNPSGTEKKWNISSAFLCR
jgi:hypothetical protein